MIIRTLSLFNSLHGVYFFMLLLLYAEFFSGSFFSKTLTECPTVWIQIRIDLIWVQTVCKGCQQMTKVSASKGLGHLFRVFIHISASI